METQKGPIKTTVPLKGGPVGFHVSWGECRVQAWALGFRVYGSGFNGVFGLTCNPLTYSVMEYTYS